MTSKEALEDLIKRNEYFKKNGVHIGTKTIDKIRELVERDTPMKVIKMPNWDYHCPKCKEEIDVSNVDFYCKQVYRYCYHCGKRLDWSEIND